MKAGWYGDGCVPCCNGGGDRTFALSWGREALLFGFKVCRLFVVVLVWPAVLSLQSVLINFVSTAFNRDSKACISICL